MEPIDSEGRTVAEAVEAALRKSGLRRDQVEVSVIQEASSGFMGLGLGASSARIRLSEKRWSPDDRAIREEAHLPNSVRKGAAPAITRGTIPASTRRQDAAPAVPHPLSPAEAVSACAKARDLVVELLGLMQVAAPTASASWDGDLERVKIAVESQDASLLIGRDGRVLESLQFLVTLMLSRANGAPVAVQVDALSYWEKREQAVLETARRAVETVKATGKPVRMEPMDSAMRRLIHRTLSTNPDVTTSSEGEGPWRKLVIRAKQE